MKHVLWVVFSGVLLCGCKPEPHADLQAISRKLDNLQQMQVLLFSNQVLLAAEFEHQSTNLPNVRQVNDLDYYYYTNTAAKLNDINEGGLLVLKQNSWLMNIASESITNSLNANGELKADAIENETIQIQEMLSNLNFAITNGTTGDILDTKLKVDEMDRDIERIEVRLGI